MSLGVAGIILLMVDYHAAIGGQDRGSPLRTSLSRTAIYRASTIRQLNVPLVYISLRCRRKTRRPVLLGCCEWNA